MNTKNPCNATVEVYSRAVGYFSMKAAYKQGKLIQKGWNDGLLKHRSGDHYFKIDEKKSA